MSIQAILLPVFVLVALTFALMFWMAFSRIGALKRQEVKIGDVALGQPKWPQKPQQIANCFGNQFQLPMLFYVLVVLTIATKSADLLFVIMSWIFVITRLAHAYVHTGSNYVRHRFNAFAVGAVVLLLMWAIFAFRILIVYS